MPIQIGQRPDHGFDEPLGLLSDCHRRIEHFLQILLAVTREVSGGPLTDAYRRAVDGSLTYFSVAAPRHTADEEQSLFPRLRASANTAVRQALASLDALEHDHEEAEADHAAVDTLFRQWLANDCLSQPEIDQLRERLDRLHTLYQRHIAVEDREVFPLAAQLLDRRELEQIGGEMAERRNVRVATRP